jgi:hypothetical protein
MKGKARNRIGRIFTNSRKLDEKFWVVGEFSIVPFYNQLRKLVQSQGTGVVTKAGP